MNETYDVAALRHWRDGRLLEDSRRLPNADQLFGFAAECAIKYVLGLVGRAVSKSEATKEHVDRLWEAVRLHSVQRRFPGLFAVLKQSNPFHDWSTDQRYQDDSAVTEEALRRHGECTKRVLGAVGLGGARLDKAP